MSITRAIVTVLISVLLLAAIGAGIGGALGHFTPGYYRQIFRNGHDPQFDPLSVGIGQGLTQGVAGGVIVGLALVALLCWREVRLAPASENAPSTTGNAGKPRRTLLVAGTLLLLIFCSLVAFVLGALLESRNLYHNRYLEEQAILAPVMDKDPAFASIDINERSNGGVYLHGKVPTPHDLERLRIAVTHAVGEPRAKSLVAGISVARHE